MFYLDQILCPQRQTGYVDLQKKKKKILQILHQGET